MRVGIIQSSYIPWRGYFDFIASVDLFIFYDDVQFSKGSWRNRNQLKTMNGPKWLTVPVRHESLQQRICDTSIDERQPWRERHRALWHMHYGSAPYLADVLQLLGEQTADDTSSLSILNISLTRRICSYLDIRTPFMTSKDFQTEGKGTQRLISLLQQVGARTYLSGPSADDYLEKDLFSRSDIRLEYKTYDYQPYRQLGQAFAGAVTVLDLIANHGSDAANHIRSRSANKVIVP